MINNEDLSHSLTYAQYCALIGSLLKENKSTGQEQTEEYLGFSKINLHRMRRLDKTIQLSPDLITALEKVSTRFWLVAISEGWCGDAAQNLPLFNLIAQKYPVFELCILLRDENPEVMDQYLTAGARSIPKVICLDKNNMEEKFVWGPRPAVLQEKVIQLLRNKGTKEEKGLMNQHWYNADKTSTQQNEILKLVRLL